MEPLRRCLPCLLVLGCVSACEPRSPDTGLEDMSLQELQFERDGLRYEQGAAARNFSAWQLHQNNAAMVLMEALRIDVGPVCKKRPPSDILRAQREGVRALMGDATLTDKAKSRWLSKWETHQRHAAEVIARSYGESPEEGAGPMDLLDLQEKNFALGPASGDRTERKIEMISAEIERRTLDPPDGSEATPSEGDAGDGE